MTGSNTDKVQTSLFVCAASIVLKIARPLFDAGSRNGINPDNPKMIAWQHLRSFVDVFLDRESTRLTVADHRDLNAALRAAHDHAHDVPITGAIPVESCKCEMSSWIAELRAVMKADEMQRAAASLPSSLARAIVEMDHAECGA